MQLLQGTSIGDVELIALRGLKVSRRLPDGPLSEADRKALSGKSQAIEANVAVEIPPHAVISVLRVLEVIRDVDHIRIPPRMGGGDEFLG